MKEVTNQGADVSLLQPQSHICERIEMDKQIITSELGGSVFLYELLP